ncbi:MAG: LysM peptidoglycan-binding domain-containing protein [Candidatus Obscuribacterales bacterium]|nr:LysM peptidoglycan-binding domain-containing protein [Candidatus Obscuribacterales bacterium]
MEDWCNRGSEKNSENNSRLTAASCLVEGGASDCYLQRLNQDFSKQSNSSLGLPELQLDTALNFKPAEKGSKAYSDWQERAKERSSAALDPNCKNETTVQKGDSLWGVAERSMKEKGGDFTKKDVLAEMNKIIAANKDQYPWLEKNPNFLKEGMQLKLPETKAAQEDSNKGRASSNAAEELSNMAKKLDSNGKGRTSSNAAEELSFIAKNLDSNSKGRTSSNAAEELSNLAKTKAPDAGRRSSNTLTHNFGNSDIGSIDSQFDQEGNTIASTPRLPRR